MDKLSSTIDLLKKFSKLTDQQYKQILNDSSKLKVLDENNLLDDFYKARPDKSYEELLQDYEFKKSLSDAPVKIEDPTVVEFIKDFGNESIDIELLENLRKYVGRLESFDESEIYRLIDSLWGLKLKDIINLYYKNIRQITPALYHFIDAYKKLDKLLVDTRSDRFEYQEQLVKAYQQIVVEKAFIIFQQINKISKLDTDKPFQDLVLSKIEESLKLRDSNLFDFIFSSPF